MPSSLAISSPKMTLVGIRAVHPWIDSKMRVIGFQEIQSDAAFVGSGLLLSQAVNSVVMHFQLNPPKQLVIVDDSLQRLQANISITTSTSTSASANAGVNNGAVGNNKGRTMSSRFGKKTTAPPPAYDASPPKQQYELPPHFNQIIVLTDGDRRQQHATLENLVSSTSTMYYVSHTYHDLYCIVLLYERNTFILQASV